jgi:NitT/TauT family transport system substrate-binding protein
MKPDVRRPHVSRRTAVSFLAFATAAAAAIRPRQASALEQIRVGTLITEACAPLNYGIKTGKFERAGIDVQFTGTNSGAASMAAVVAGSYEIAGANLLSISSAHVRQIPISLVAPQVLYTTRTKEAMLQVAVNESYRTGADLAGKTIGVPTLEGINALAAKAWVDKNGGDWTTLKFVEIPNAAQPQALAQHRIDAAILEPPVLDASVADGTSKTIGDPMGAIGSNYMIAGYVAQSDWAAQHPDLLKRFNRVLSESAKYVNTHLAETAPLVAEFTKIDLAVVSKMSRTMSGINLDAAMVQPLIDAAAKYKFIARPFSARELFWSGA